MVLTPAGMIHSLNFMGAVGLTRPSRVETPADIL